MTFPDANAHGERQQMQKQTTAMKEKISSGRKVEEDSSIRRRVALFLTGPGVTTLPIEIFSFLQFQGGQLLIAAASAVQVGIIAIMVVVMERLVGLNRVVRSN